MSTSSKPAIVVRNVSKVYEDKRLWAQFTHRKNREHAEVHALDDISLVAYSGESIGLLGRNGSGKSTLLRQIAGVELPTSGEVLVSAEPTLLGVSAALQSQLSGLQNIRLGLLAQGLTPKQVSELEDSVADFSEIGDAVYRPMKTYSSGMSARLKFSIATAVRREILLVDEALSTGDVAFANRAQERMKGFIAAAGTIFIVSHGTATIDELCSRAIWLEKGKIVADGEAREISKRYRRWARFLSTGEHEKADEILQESTNSYKRPAIVFDTEAASILGS